MEYFRKYIGIGLIAAMVALTGCASQSPTEADYGNSVRNMVRSQTAIPNASIQNKERTANKGDGQRGEVVLEGYRDVAAKDEQVGRDLIIQMGAGNQ